MQFIVLTLFPYFFYPLNLLFHIGWWLIKGLDFKELLAKTGFIKTWLHFSPIKTQGKPCTWVHVSSLGELNTALPFLQKYRQHFKSPLLLTYFNSDISKAPQLKQIADVYFPLPFELPWAYKTILTQFQVRRLFVFETEIWPVLLTVIKKKAIPAFNLNAYINAEQIANYQRWAWLFKKALKAYCHFFVRNQLDKKHFVDLGVNENHITVVGNLKLDILSSNPEPSSDLTKSASLIKTFTQGHTTIVLASIHPGEVPLLVPLINSKFKTKIPSKWIIAPRYLTTLPLIKKTLIDHSLGHLLFSELKAMPSDSALNKSVLLVDGYGLLKTVYQCTDMAIIGGSFIPWGGQNPLESIAHNVTTLMGPHHHHFVDIVEEFFSYIKIVTIEELLHLLQDWIKAPETLPKDNGYRHLLTCTGASDATLEGLKKLIPYIKNGNH